MGTMERTFSDAGKGLQTSPRFFFNKEVGSVASFPLRRLDAQCFANRVWLRDPISRVTLPVLKFVSKPKPPSNDNLDVI